MTTNANNAKLNLTVEPRQHDHGNGYWNGNVLAHGLGYGHGFREPHWLPPRTLLDVFEAAFVSGDVRGYTFINNDGSERYIGFRTMVAEARARGRKMRARGLSKGDRVALIIPEADEFVLTFLGAVSAGIVPVPLYPPLSLGRLDAYLDTTVRILNAASADLLITTGQVQKILWSVMPRVPSLRDLITLDKLDAGKESTAASIEVLPGDPVFLQFTSGSTAAPKGVVVTHASLCANTIAIMGDGLKSVPGEEVGVSWLPLYHDMGLIGFVIAPLVWQQKVVFIPTLAFVKRPTLWMDTVHKHRGTITFAPNFAFARLVKRATDADLAKWDLSCLRVVGCGAEPIHAGTMRAFVERFSQGSKLNPDAILPCYGMAEATLAMTFGKGLHIDAIESDACYAERKAVPAASHSVGPLELVACGNTMPGHDVAIFNDEDERCGERQIGEICFRGPSVAAGYFRNAEATRETIRDGWLRTGDLGYLADGRLYISGRKKDILIINGRNYYPQGIEWLVEEVAGLRKGSVVAFSVPGAASEELVIVAETAETDAAKRKALAQAVKSHISANMALVVGDVLLLGPGELPKTTSGKLQRRKTREQYMARTLGMEGVRSVGSTAEKLSLARHLVRSFISRVRHRAATLLGNSRQEN